MPGWLAGCSLCTADRTLCKPLPVLIKTVVQSLVGEFLYEQNSEGICKGFLCKISIGMVHFCLLAVDQ